MSVPRFFRVAFPLAACVLALTAPPVGAGQADGDAEGLARSELTLDGRGVSVTWDPALASDHRTLLALRAGSTQASVRLGRIEGHRSLVAGTLAPDPDEPRGPAPNHDLWLMRTGAGWVLDARPVEEPAEPSDGEDAGGTAGEAGDSPAEEDNAADASASATTDAGAADADEDAGGEAGDPPADEGDEDAANAGAADADTEVAGADADESNADAPDVGALDDAAADAGTADDADADGGREASGEAAPAPRPGRILLTHRPRAAEAETLSVGLRPTGDAAGTLSLSWGRNDWTADFEFVELPRPTRPPRTSNVGPGTSLTRDSDLEARYRAAALGSRNETALVTPDGIRIQVLFEQELGTDGVDFAALESIGDGDLVQLTQGAVIRLRSEAALRFGDTLIPTGNLAPDFPGSYGLWLRASGPGWTLVFNNEPDSWGTQHDPAFDAAEIDVLHTHGGPWAARPLGVSLRPVDDDEGRLVIHWGQHVWTADFTIEP